MPGPMISEVLHLPRRSLLGSDPFILSTPSLFSPSLTLVVSSIGKVKGKYYVDRTPVEPISLYHKGVLRCSPSTV